MSIFGTWIITNGSDHYPPIHYLHPDIPVAGFLVGGEGEELVIRQSHLEQSSTSNFGVQLDQAEQSHLANVEEILLTYRSKAQPQATRAYQLGKWNIEKYEKYVISAIIIASLSNEASTFLRSFVIIRYGPVFSVQSIETYSLSTDGNILTIELQVTYAGLRTNLTKLLRRKSSLEEIKFYHYPRTLGWLKESNRSSKVLKETVIRYLEAISLTVPHIAKNDDHLCITRRIGEKCTDGESIVTFKFQVTCRHRTWFILHRYKEFDALKVFLEGRKKHLPSKYWKDLGEEPPFPSKKVFSLSAHSKATEQRALMLQEYLSYHISKGGHDIPGLVDTLCSFLEIPEHLYESPAAPVLPPAPPASQPVNANNGARRGIFVESRQAPTQSGAVAAAIGPQPELHFAGPREELLRVLAKGLVVIKHGREGRPHRRLIQCNQDVTRIFWQEEPLNKTGVPGLPDLSKSILLSEVKGIRRATDVESTTTKGQQLLGTAIFRKSRLAAAELALSFSLLLPDRSFDLQCLRKEDFDILYVNLKKLYNIN